jgi:hypothetical protein
MNTQTTSVEEAEKEIDCPLARMKRNEGEPYDDFSKDRYNTNRMIRLFLKGRLFHSNENGTYNVARRLFKETRKINRVNKIKRFKADRRKKVA